MKTYTNTDRRGRLATVVMAATAALGIAVWAPASAAENFGSDIVDSFKNGEFDVNLRYRYEFVDQSDNGKRDANASTLRTRLVFRTAKWNDLDITINMDDVRPIVANNFNDTRNGKTQYQTVADPRGTDLNIAALTYSGLKNTQFILGRQRITRGDHRFIGNVGWRQNEQTYDAISANYKDEVFSASYAYIDRVKRIFGPEAPPAGTIQPAATITANAWKSDSHLLDAAYTLNNALSVAVYGYFLDFKSALAASNQTIGIRFSGAPKIAEDWTINYVAEYAAQEDYGVNQNKYSADFMRASLGFKWKWLGVTAGYELLEADGGAGVAFQTPLATLHAMNGWADKFLATPAGGLEDVTIAASAKVSKGTLKLVYHDYSADIGGVDYGTEIDFVAKWPIAKNYSVLGKLALYDADTNAPAAGGLNQDTEKVWLMMTAAF